MQTLKHLLGRSLYALRLDTLLMRHEAVVVAFHRVRDDADLTDSLTVHSRTFESYCRFFKRFFNVVPLADPVETLHAGRAPHRALAITFDDGYRDNFTHAYPVLKRHGVPGTFFVATGNLDHPRLPWWDEIAWMVRNSASDRVDLRPWRDDPVVFDEPDREHAVRVVLRTYKSLPTADTAAFLEGVAAATGIGRYDQSRAGSLWMTWDMVREMRDGGMAIGGHSITHSLLSRMPPEAQWHEIYGCRQRLQEELHQPMDAFSYPVGSRDSFNEATRECLRRAGVRYAFTYYGGLCRFHGVDEYDMPRTMIEPYVGRHWFRSIVQLPQFFA